MASARRPPSLALAPSVLRSGSAAVHAPGSAAVHAAGSRAVPTGASATVASSMFRLPRPCRRRLGSLLHFLTSRQQMHRERWMNRGAGICKRICSTMSKLTGTMHTQVRCWFQLFNTILVCYSCTVACLSGTDSSFVSQTSS
jgi:hypothetical protein